jgi:hypothetical protein
MWKNIVEPKMTIWRMRIACWITKITHTHSLTTCNTHCFSTATVVGNVTFYVHCLFYYYFIQLITYIGILYLHKLSSELKKQKPVVSWHRFLQYAYHSKAVLDYFCTTQENALLLWFSYTWFYDEMPCHNVMYLFNHCFCLIKVHRNWKGGREHTLNFVT